MLVVILSPDHINLRIFGQEVLHDTEASSRFQLPYWRSRIRRCILRRPLAETVLTLLIDRDRQAANDDDLGIGRVVLIYSPATCPSAGLPAT